MTKMVKTVRTEVNRGDEDPTIGLIRAAIPSPVGLKAEGYYSALVTAAIPELVLDVFKKKRNFGGLSKVGEIIVGEMDPQTIEPWIIQSWKSGTYQFRPALRGKYYAPASMLLKIGEDDEDVLPPSGAATPDDVDSIIAENVKRIGHVNVMSRLATIAKEFDPKKPEGDEGEGGMKTAELLAMVQAMNQPLIAMLNASEARTARAEERADKLLERLTTNHGMMSAVKEPLFAEILKKAVDKPEALALLMGGSSPSAEPAEEGGWSGLIKAALEQFAPMVQTYMAMQLQKAGMPSLPPAAVAAPGGEGAPLAPPDAPTPPAQGDRRMPMELNEEQLMAKEYLLDFIKSGDLDNAFSTLEAFPGFIPTAQGPMPLGEAILSSIDPDANPRVYLPKLAMLLPEIIKEKMGPLMVKFISHVQDRLRKMQQEAAQPAPEMRPTSREGAQ